MTPDKLFQCREFVRFFALACANGQLYSPTHSQVARLCKKANEALKKAIGKEPLIAFLFIDNNMVADNQPLEKDAHTARVQRAFREKKIEHVEFTAEITEKDLLVLVGNLLNPVIGHAELAPSDHVRFGKIVLSASEGSDTNLLSETDQSRIPIEDLPKTEFRIFAEIYEQAKKRQNFSLNGLEEMVSGLIEFLRDDLSSFLVLASIQDKDGYTFTHSTNVSILNLAQAISLGIEDRTLHDIGISGMLHDVGKLFVPEEILCKSEKLTPEELLIIQQHPVQGAAYLYNIPQIPPMAVSTAFEHHLQFNTKGYPKVPEGWNMNLCSLITAISDVFDALRTKRSYQEASDFETTKEILLKLSGTNLHPGLTRNFIALVESAGASIP